MTTKPTLSQTLNSEYTSSQFYNPKKHPEKLPNRKRLLYEIEKILEIEKEELKIESVRKKNTKSGRTTIPNRDIYRIYKAILNMRNVRPQIVYTGGSIMDISEAQELLCETGKDLSELEPTL